MPYSTGLAEPAGLPLRRFRKDFVVCPTRETGLKLKPLPVEEEWQKS